MDQHFHELLHRINRGLNAIVELLYLRRYHLEKIMSVLTDLQSAVAAERGTVNSAITLITGFKAALDAAIASGDPAALQALSADIGQQTADLAAAVAANPLPSNG
jgi:hypothetical protein